ncbi:coniferyl-aldehyde dehydrogenase [Aliidiomarina shirensis]|uniref:Aldehyde dehydrogenase n=1 Tax=Aliidiomarina shirensis TaxID=1048642 RepID=A0A432WQR0_9GAMM|nr:coniferyl aldehyde dehydrogenase [Aliidiomarina shirensis]RUO36017.1 coniferyl-aldehyde dehydrogenase [Aliidiomarina shirensis]
MSETKEMQQLLSAQQTHFNAAPYWSAAERIERLNKLKAALLNQQEALINAISEDFGRRSADETRLAELLPSVEGINYVNKRIRKWLRPSRRKVGLAFQPASARVEYQPLGVVGIIVPWNYPLYLAMGPLTAAIAAGNRAMIKMSEFTPATAAAFTTLLAEVFPPEEVCVITGEAEVAAEFSRLPFDHMLFTGGTNIGRHVMKAAAENLTPVTLELGGKSPAIIGKADTNIASAAERIAFGKALNAGQTCVAPDYVLCPEDKLNTVVAELTHAFTSMYPSFKENDDYSWIINAKQFDRLHEVLQDAISRGANVTPINPKNESFSGTRIIPPTLITGAKAEMKVLQDEIFGPVLPIITYREFSEALEYVRQGDRPLALYYFGDDRAERDLVLKTTHSGGVCINDTVFHVAQDDLPFGGVGPSGMGHYHGHEGFLTFSKARAVLQKGKLNSAKFVYPPYGGKLLNMIYKLFIR